MPEVWLPYGRVEVSASLSTDRLGPILRPEFGEPLPIEALRREIEGLGLKGKVAVLGRGLPDRLLEEVREALRELGVEPFTPGGLKPKRSVLIDGASVELPEPVKLLVVSCLRPDGFFGVYCPASALVEALGEGVMGEVFKRFEGRPEPLEETGALWFSRRVAEELGALGLGILLERGIRWVRGGEPGKVAEEGARLLRESATKRIRGMGLVASPGFEEKGSLASCLKAMWNVSGLKDGSGLLMLCESSGGLGSRALELYMRGLIKEGHRGYVEGLEDLVMLGEVRERLKLGLVSGLPLLYVKKLGFEPFRSLSEGVESLKGYGRLSFAPEASLTVVRSR